MAHAKIDRVLQHDGIVAVLDWKPGAEAEPRQAHPQGMSDWGGGMQAAPNPPRWAGDERWHPIVHEAVRLRQLSGEDSVRVLVGDHAVLVSGDDRHVVGVVFIKGHPVVKSVVRMVRQMLRPPGASSSSGKRRAKPKTSVSAPLSASKLPANSPMPSPEPGAGHPRGTPVGMGQPMSMGAPGRPPMGPPPAFRAPTGVRGQPMQGPHGHHPAPQGRREHVDQGQHEDLRPRSVLPQAPGSSRPYPPAAAMGGHALPGKGRAANQGAVPDYLPPAPSQSYRQDEPAGAGHPEQGDKPPFSLLPAPEDKYRP